MPTAINTLRGATDTILEKLGEKGVKDNAQLLAAASTPSQRKELAAHCGCTAKEILELANRADLARIKGVSGVYSDLLERAGVDTVKELAQRRPDNLHAKITATNQQANLTKQSPSPDMVKDWVAQAKQMPTMLTY